MDIMLAWRVSPILLHMTLAIASVTPHIFPGTDQTGFKNGYHSIHKRHALQMCELIATHTGRGCLDYNNYGCFCGLGNVASQPVDEVDECCRIHDRCYGDAACFWLYPQFVGYTANCTTRPCICTDSPLFSPCAYTTCQCDVEFAECLATATYHRRYYEYNRENCSRRRRRRLSRRRSRRSITRKQWFNTLLRHSAQ